MLLQTISGLNDFSHFYLGSNGDVSYKVLWLPPRYPFFVLYVIEVVLILLTVCFIRSRYRTH